MPAYEIPLRNNASQVVLRSKNVDYPIDLDAHGYTRVGEDGTIKLLSIFGGDEFYGKHLERIWGKDWSTGMDANQTFTAIIDTTAHQLFMQGEADVAGVSGFGWAFCNKPMPMIDTAELTVAMSVPVDDTGAVAARDLHYSFFLTRDKATERPYNYSNWLRFNIWVDENGLLLRVQKNVDGSITTLFDGKTYDDATTVGTGDVEAVIWKIVFHGKAGTSGAHMHVYIKQSDTIDNAEGTEWTQLSTSPFDVDDLYFNVGYPSLEIISQNTSYFDAGNEAKCGYLRVDYPDFEVVPNGDRFENEVEIWDGDPDASGKRVRDIDHVFVNDVYVRNGLIQQHIDAGIINGLKQYLYLNSAYDISTNTHGIELEDSNKTCYYPYFEKILYMSPEKVQFRVKVCEDAVNDDDYYVKVDITVKRGQYHFLYEFHEAYPHQQIRYFTRMTPEARFSYVGDDLVGDADLDISPSNTTMSDNFMQMFDDAGDAKIMFTASNKKPTAQYSFDGRSLEYKYISADDVTSIKVVVGTIPFSLIANLFKEAEDMSESSNPREFIDAEHDGFDSDDKGAYDDDGVTEAQPEAGHTVHYADDETNWSAYNWGVGSYASVASEETTIVKVGTSSIESAIGAGANANCGISYDFGAGTEADFSGETYIGFWYYGANSGLTAKIYFSSNAASPVADYYSYTFTDNIAGWRWICLDRASGASTGAPNWASVRRMLYALLSVDGNYTFYVDNVITFDGLWTETTNVTITINDETEEQVNNYAVKIVSDAGGGTNAQVYPITPIANLLKFDSLKYWLKADGLIGRTMYIIDSDGDSIRKAYSNSSTMTEQTVEIPHNAAEITSLGWVESGTFNFEGFERLSFRWSASGASEELFLDGLHFYIGNTTTKGRGESISGSLIVLDYDEETIVYSPVAGTDLPAGRYLALWRLKDTDQVAGDLRTYIDNTTDSKYRNEENASRNKTLTASFAYYPMVFDITDADASDGDTIRIRVDKRFSTENTIFVDSVVLFYLGDGNDGPMDIAHNPLRALEWERRIEQK